MSEAAQLKSADTAGTLSLWLEILALALGSLTYASDPLSFIQPQLAVVAILWLATAATTVRVIPALRRRPALRGGLEVGALLVYVTLLTTSTGATSSPFIALYILPLLVTALVGRRWQVFGLAGLIVGLTLVMSGLLDPMNDMYLLTTGVVLLNVLAPGIVAAMLIGSFKDRIGVVEQRAVDLAATDLLTGVLNLQSFEALLARQEQQAAHTGHPYSILVIDIDNVRQVNESLGHEAGNQLIAAVAKAVTRSIRTTDHAARMGGDVFVVLLTEADQAVAQGIAQRVRNNVYNGTLRFENRMIRATVSIGAASCPRDAQTGRALMVAADSRMQQDKLLRRAPGRAS